MVRGFAAVAPGLPVTCHRNETTSSVSVKQPVGCRKGHEPNLRGRRQRLYEERTELSAGVIGPPTTFLATPDALRASLYARPRTTEAGRLT